MKRAKFHENTRLYSDWSPRAKVAMAARWTQEETFSISPSRPIPIYGDGEEAEEAEWPSRRRMAAWPTVQGTIRADKDCNLDVTSFSLRHFASLENKLAN